MYDKRYTQLREGTGKLFWQLSYHRVEIPAREKEEKRLDPCDGGKAGWWECGHEDDRGRWSDVAPCQRRYFLYGGGESRVDSIGLDVSIPSDFLLPSQASTTKLSSLPPRYIYVSPPDPPGHCTVLCPKQVKADFAFFPIHPSTHLSSGRQKNGGLITESCLSVVISHFFPCACT